MAVGSVLLADDEETFRESTSRLLRRDGFDCRCAKDAEEALDSLRHVRFDVFVSDIRMPCNPDMRIVKEARQIDAHLPIILVTGYPSAETAIRGVNLAVEAYLTKPLDYEELRGHVFGAVKRSHVRRRISSVVERLASVMASIEAETSIPLSPEKSDDSAVVIIRSLASCLSDLLILWCKPATEHGISSLCELLDCPQQPVHRQAILHAIDVLEKTKDNFKSKQLAELRVNLQQAVGIRQRKAEPFSG